MRPTQRDTGGVRELEDQQVPDFLEAHRVVLLAFLDSRDPRCDAMRVRLEVLAAKWMAAGSAGPAAGQGERFGAGVVDVSRHRLVAEATGVKTVPQVLLFVDGAVADRLIGSPPEAILDEVLRTRLGT